MAGSWERHAEATRVLRQRRRLRLAHACRHAPSHTPSKAAPAPLRYTYGETLGRWRTADLLIGLAYLCRKVGAAGWVGGPVGVAGGATAW